MGEGWVNSIKFLEVVLYLQILSNSISLLEGRVVQNKVYFKNTKNYSFWGGGWGLLDNLILNYHTKGNLILLRNEGKTPLKRT